MEEELREREKMLEYMVLYEKLMKLDPANKTPGYLEQRLEDIEMSLKVFETYYGLRTPENERQMKFYEDSYSSYDRELIANLNKIVFIDHDGSEEKGRSNTNKEEKETSNTNKEEKETSNTNGDEKETSNTNEEQKETSNTNKKEKDTSKTNEEQNETSNTNKEEKGTSNTNEKEKQKKQYGIQQGHSSQKSPADITITVGKNGNPKTNLKYFKQLKICGDTLQKGTNSKIFVFDNTKGNVDYNEYKKEMEQCIRMTKRSMGIYGDKIICLYCANDDHTLVRCNDFMKLDVEQRVSTVKSLEVCQNCLCKHGNMKCNSKKRCLKCKKAHHTMLHYNK